MYNSWEDVSCLEECCSSMGVEQCAGHFSGVLYHTAVQQILEQLGLRNCAQPYSANRHQKQTNLTIDLDASN